MDIKCLDMKLIVMELIERCVIAAVIIKYFPSLYLVSETDVCHVLSHHFLDFGCGRWFTCHLCPLLRAWGAGAGNWVSVCSAPVEALTEHYQACKSLQHFLWSRAVTLDHL